MRRRGGRPATSSLCLRLHVDVDGGGESGREKGKRKNGMEAWLRVYIYI